MCLWQNRKRKFPMFLPKILNAHQQLFWYLSLLVISHLPFRGGEPWLLTHNLASDVTAGAPGWPRLEDGRVLGLLEVLGPCPGSPALPRLHTQFQHSLVQEAWSHTTDALIKSASSYLQGEEPKWECMILPTPQNIVQGNSSSLGQRPPNRNCITG